MTTVKLKKPIEHKGKTYSEFTFREASTGDLMMSDKFEGQTSKIVAMLASMAEVELAVFKLLPAREFSRIMTEVGDLLGESEPVTTGA